MVNSIKSSTFAPHFANRHNKKLQKQLALGYNVKLFFTMYVIVDIQGQQFKVVQDQKLFVHKINAEQGSEVEFTNVMLVDNDGAITVGAPTVEGAKVILEVVTPLVKGDKVLVFKKKRRKGYRKLNGHRQQFSEVRVKQIIA